MEQFTYIYALFDPTIPEIIRYIGKSDNPKKRLYEHTHENGKTRKAKWIKSIKKRGIYPEYKILKMCNVKHYTFWESYFIKLNKSKYLTNADDTGLGTLNPQPKNFKNLRKKVYRYDLEGNFICNYCSVREASRKLNIYHSHIVRCCKGEIKHTQCMIFSYKKISPSKIENPNAVKKAVVEIDINNNVLNEWNSISECSRYTKIDNGNISRVCNNLRHSIKGRFFIFKGAL